MAPRSAASPRGGGAATFLVTVSAPDDAQAAFGDQELLADLGAGAIYSERFQVLIVDLDSGWEFSIGHNGAEPLANQRQTFIELAEIALART